jgi:O-antigen/teichoic acid export membrane protein
MIIPWLGPTSFAAMSGYALASLIVFGSQLLLLKRAVPLRRLAAHDAEESDALTRQMLAYAWPFVLPGVIAWLQAASDRWALQIFGGSNSVGIYAAAYQLGYYPMILISNAVTQFIAPVLFAGAGVAQSGSRVQESVRLNRSIVMWWLGFSAVATAVAVGLLSEGHLVSMLVTGKYREGLTYVPWMVLSSGLFAAGQTSALTIMVGTKTRLLFLPMATVATAGLILNFIGAYLLGIRGVVATTVLLGAGSFVWTFLLARRYEQAVRISAAC